MELSSEKIQWVREFWGDRLHPANLSDEARDLLDEQSIMVLEEVGLPVNDPDELKPENRDKYIKWTPVDFVTTADEYQTNRVIDAHNMPFVQIAGNHSNFWGIDTKQFEIYWVMTKHLDQPSARPLTFVNSSVGHLCLMMTTYVENCVKPFRIMRENRKLGERFRNSVDEIEKQQYRILIQQLRKDYEIAAREIESMLKPIDHKAFNHVSLRCWWSDKIAHLHDWFI